MTEIISNKALRNAHHVKTGTTFEGISLEMTEKFLKNFRATQGQIDWKEENPQRPRNIWIREVKISWFGKQGEHGEKLTMQGKTKKLEFMVGSMYYFLNHEKEEEEEETKRKKTQIDREIQEENTSWEEGGKRQHKEGENGDGEEEDWLKSDWIEKGWITKKPQEDEDWWTAKEREEETTIKKHEIEDKKWNNGDPVANDCSPSYFSSFSNASTMLNLVDTPNSKKEIMKNNGK